MGCRTYFREGSLVVPKAGTTLEEMRQALAKHLEQDGTLEDLLATQTLGLEPLTGDPPQALLAGDYEAELGPLRLEDLEKALKVIAPFLDESVPDSYLTYSNDEEAFWRYIVCDGQLMVINGQMTYDGMPAELV